MEEISVKLHEWLVSNRMTSPGIEIISRGVFPLDGIGDVMLITGDGEYVIDEDFGFILSDEEFNTLESKEVGNIVFMFGGRFFYSQPDRTRNKYGETVYKPHFNDLRNIGKADYGDDEYPHLNNIGIHTEYEILSGSGSCDAWVKKGVFLGCDALGVCDKNTLASSLQFQTVCEKKGIKSIIGETVTVAANYDKKATVQETFELKLYVCNSTGWKNLLLINKCINVDYDGFIPEEELYKYGEGLVCVIPEWSRFNYVLNNGDFDSANLLLKKYRKTFDEVYYQIDTVEFSSESIFKQHLNCIDTYIMRYSNLLKPILINDSFYIEMDEAVLKRMLIKVSGVAVAESENQYFKDYKDTIEAYGEWSHVDRLYQTILTAIDNCEELTKSIDFKIPSGERKLPEFEVDDVEGLFFEKLQAGIEERLCDLSDSDMKVYLERVEKECNVIVPNGLCDYFMILWDIINWCHENGINTGPGRGSVCGSLVAYLLHITDVDPLKYGLLFERFLNEARVSGERAKSADALPDVDCDFPAEYRDIVKEYIKEQYGYDYTCSIGTYTRMKLKTCIKDFGKVWGFNFDYTNKLTKNIDDQIEYTWGDLFEYASHSKMLYKFVQENPELVYLIKAALLIPKAESVHPSAVVIVPKHDSEGNSADLWGWIPIKKIDGLLVSQWEGKYIDKSGFLKEDILGLSQLDKFSSMLQLIRENRGIDIDVNKIEFDDTDVFKYFKRGWNEDVFQFGTAGLSNYCKQVKPTNIEDLIAMTALFRPGPMDVNAHQDFVEIKNGRKKPEFDFGMQDITKETFSLYVYQEQIMKAVIVAGLTAVESDTLRTTIKKKDAVTLGAFGDKFKSGYIALLEKNGIKNADKYAERVWNKLLAFSGYGFNKSHAAAYTIMSYWCQWFKVNYPLEFWTTALQFAKESEVPYRIAEMKKTGVEIEIRPPDINYSEGNFTCDAKNDRIFFSITKIKGVGDVAVRNILETRSAGGKFFSLEEFLSRVPSKVNETVVKRLIIAGAFDLIEEIDQPRKRKELLARYLETKGESLPEEYTVPESVGNAFWIIEQKKITGFGEVDYETMIRDAITNKRIANKYVDDVGFNDAKEGDEVTIAGKLIFYKENTIKNGVMCNLQIECNNTIIPVLLWPSEYVEMREEIEDLKGSVLAINGIVKKDKFRNEKKLYSDKHTKYYVLREEIK